MHHLLGTDQLGRDILARLLVATRLSIGLALASTALAMGFGVALGSSTALAGPKLRLLLLRVIDTLMSFPVLLTAIFATTIIGGGAKGAVLGVGIAISFNIARISSSLAISIGSRDYVDAARVLGVRGPRLMLRYVLPNIAEPLIVGASVAIGASILQVSALSFLGLGVQPPQWDWGGMLTLGVKSIYLPPAGALGPAAAIAIAYVAFGLTGEGVARAMNPLLWTTGAKRDTRLAAEAEKADFIASGQVPGVALDDRPAVEIDERPVGEPVEEDALNPSDDGIHDAFDALAAGAAEPEELALEVKDLVVTFPGPNGPIDIVKGVSFSVRSGEIVGIVGESGSGKTMTALSVGQLTPYPGRVAGSVKLHGRELAEIPSKQRDKFLGTELAIVFQDPMSSLNPALRIGRQLTEGVRVHRKLSRKAATKLAVDSLTEVHIPAAERQIERYPHEFSGGMRQRAMIAMGLMKEPSLLLADEPTTALDVTIQAQIIDLLEEVNTEHSTAVILISHNLALVSQACDRVLVMYAGRVVEDLDAEQLTTNPMHPYTRALLGAVPQIDRPRDQPLEYIPGETPDIGSPPPGCPYHPRCPLAEAICSERRPRLVRRADGRRVACHVANRDLAA
jgi:oligopeptide/dipeptide ABC transporter ATP-binding protein